MPTSTRAREAAEEVPLCPECLEHEGLCHSVKCRSVLPQLKEPGWYRDVHSGRWIELGKKTAPASPAAERAKRRNERKVARLSRAIGGQFTRTRRRAAA